MIDLLWNFIEQLPVGLIAIFGFLIALSPFPLPNETWMGFITAVQGNGILPVLFLVAGAGEFVGHVLIFVIAKKHIHKLTHKKRSELAVDHWYHKYGVWVFLVLPTLSFLVPLTDFALLISAHEKAKLSKTIIPLALGIVIRMVFGFLFLDNVI